MAVSIGWDGFADGRDDTAALLGCQQAGMLMSVRFQAAFRRLVRRKAGGFAADVYL